jgi:ABC-type Na+ efflux pump permease subunit
VLVTPIHGEEFLLGKALGVRVPTLAIAYAMFGIFLASAALFAHPVVASAVFERSHLLVQLLFTPLLAGWSIWVGIAITARSSDVRVAQQLAVVATFPPLALVALMSLDVITPTLALALGLAAASTLPGRAGVALAAEGPNGYIHPLTVRLERRGATGSRVDDLGEGARAGLPAACPPG